MIKLLSPLVSKLALQIEVTNMHTNSVAIVPVPNTNITLFLCNLSIPKFICLKLYQLFWHIGTPANQLVLG